LKGQVRTYKNRRKRVKDQIVTVVGASPQFIKAVAGSRQLRKEHEEILIHTGQPFNDNMSAIFLERWAYRSLIIIWVSRVGHMNK